MLWEELERPETDEFKRGLATGLAILLAPYSPDVEAVLRELEIRSLL